MKFGIYLKKETCFSPDELLEIHAEGMADNGTRPLLLVKKHKRLGTQPYAMVHTPSNFKTLSSYSYEYYIANNKDFLWVNKKDVEIKENNAQMKHILEKFKD